LFNTKEKRCYILDWGLSDFYHPGQNYNVRVSSRFYKGPELLAGNGFYSYSLDVWQAGCMMAGMIFNKEPFFKGESNEDQLIKIIKLLGTQSLIDYCEKYRLSIDRAFYEPKISNFTKKDLDKYVNQTNKHLVSDAGLDLLEQMLRMDHADRISAR